MQRVFRLLAHPSFRYLFAAIWLVNGLLCKVLGLVPRHEAIVAEILGERLAHPLTVLIGVSEVLMAAWIISGRRYRFCAVVQMAVILLMNLLEFFIVPDLLLWGRLNLLFSIFLVALIGFNALGRMERIPD